MSIDLSGQVALVTGAGRGLGRAHALWLAAAGAKIVVNNRAKPGRASTANAVVEEIRAAGGEAIADENPIDDPEGAERMVAAAIQAFGRLDILICNAGFTDMAPFAEMDLERFNAIMSGNFYGAMLPMRAALKEMIRAGYGRIVATTSSAAYFPIPGCSAYGAAKAALIGLVRTAATEVAGHDIKLNLISPLAFTSMNEGYLGEELSGLFSTDHIVPVAGWLCSPACDRSGAILTVGGGKVSRVWVMETAGQRTGGKDMADVLPMLDSLDGAREWETGMDTGNNLIAEFEASRDAADANP